MSQYFEIIKGIDSAPLLILSIVLFWAGSISQKIIVAWYERRGFKPNGFSEAPFILEKLIIKTVHEFNSDIGFVITHNLKKKKYSVLGEYIPPGSTLPSIQNDYQNVPFDSKSDWAMKLLANEGRIIRGNLDSVEDDEHRSHMEALNVRSWYCWALYNDDGQMIGSLNLYFINEFGMTVSQTKSLTGRVSSLGSNLEQLQADKS